MLLVFMILILTTGFLQYYLTGMTLTIKYLLYIKWIIINILITVKFYERYNQSVELGMNLVQIQIHVIILTLSVPVMHVFDCMLIRYLI